ncbi:MAG: peptidoglycan DD-metalloendopeptidase family protein [Lachnospiraceae bacterium]|nr:peptidoglycan DD-metalloendopeptidase family protein [Lachnospiraceae bacterium]
MQKRENRKKEIIKRKKQRLEKQKSILYKKKIREKNKRPYKQQALGQYVQKPSIVLRETEKPKDNKNVAGRSEENVTKSLEETDQKPSILGEFCEEDNKEHVQDKIADGNRKLDKKGSEKKQGEVRKEIRSTRAKKPEKQEYTLQKAFDVKTGRSRYVVASIMQEKGIKGNVQSNFIEQKIWQEGRNLVHKRIAEKEDENSAIEAAHQMEQKAEMLYGIAKRKGKVSLQRYQEKWNTEKGFVFEKAPNRQGKTLQKRLQKQYRKKAYSKAYQRQKIRENQKEIARETGSTTLTIVRKIQEMVKKKAVWIGVIGIITGLLLMVTTTFSSCGAIFGDTSVITLSSCYLSEPKEIDAVELAYTYAEMNLQRKISNVEIDYPGYDEYQYNLDEIGHDPFVLLSYLSAVNTEFTYQEVENQLATLIEEQYSFILASRIETRTRNVPSTDEEGNVLYDENGDARMEEEEYKVKILEVTVTAIPLETLVLDKLCQEQTEVYQAYMETKGGLQQFASPLALYWYDNISSNYGYREHPITKQEQIHRGLDIASPKGTPVYATHTGMVTTATYDSGYGNYIVITDDKGFTTKYAHLSSLQVTAGQTVEKGTEIGQVGSTGNSTGNHLHLEVLQNGQYYNPLFYFAVGRNNR